MITTEANTAADLRRARAQIAALEQLLEVHEQTSLDQATRLEQTNRELDQFAYVASHDLKAPLRGIANLAQWIEEDLGERLGEETRQHMRLLTVRVHRMEALIEGILTYSRVGRIRTKIERVDVGVMLHEAIEMLAPPEAVTVRVARPMPVLYTERVPLQQVLMNLIGNAIKYRRDEGALVVVAAEDDGELVRFVVSDNGPGIAPQFHEKIWQIFQTLAPRDEVEGTGIGLSVVKKLVEMRGGRIWLESEPGSGSTFRFTWPAGLETTT